MTELRVMEFGEARRRAAELGFDSRVDGGLFVAGMTQGRARIEVAFAPDELDLGYFVAQLGKARLELESEVVL